MTEAKSSKSSGIAKPANIECKDLQEYLKSRAPDILDKLYNYPAICLAVYRYVHLNFSLEFSVDLLNISTGNYQKLLVNL